MNVIIRNARREDLDAMTALLGELFSIEADFVIDAARQRRGLLMMLEDHRGNNCIMAAEVDGRVVGMCTVQLLISTAEGGVVGLVEDMVVGRRFRSRGIGRMLMEHIEAWAQQRDVTRLQLLADRTNRSALDFYRSMSWSATKLICVRRTWKQKKYAARHLLEEPVS
jgi:GNAT superfamily N-acetyltransferase